MLYWRRVSAGYGFLATYFYVKQHEEMYKGGVDKTPVIDVVLLMKNYSSFLFNIILKHKKKYMINKINFARKRYQLQAEIERNTIKNAKSFSETNKKVVELVKKLGNKK